MLSSALKTASWQTAGPRYASRQLLRRTQIPACALHTSRKTKAAAAVATAPSSRYVFAAIVHYTFNSYRFRVTKASYS